MLTLNFPWVFLLLPLPLIWLFLRPRSQQHEEAALQVPFYHQIESMVQPSLRQGSSVRYWLLGVVTWASLVLAASDPQWVGKPIELPQSGRNIMLAVDISGSMETPDMVINGQTVSRIDAVKHVANAFIRKRVGDNLGLIVFGSRAYVQSPLSLDHKTVMNLLDDTSIGMAGQQTAIGDAIGLAIKRLKDTPANSRVLILLTDGANNAGNVSPLSAAEMAAKEHIKIYTIGLGTEEYVIRTSFGVQRIKADIDEDSLQKIADSTGGQFFRARNTPELATIYYLLDQLEPVSSDSVVLRPHQSLFYWPLAFALVLSLVSILLWQRRGIF